MGTLNEKFGRTVQKIKNATKLSIDNKNILQGNKRDLQHTQKKR